MTNKTDAAKCNTLRADGSQLIGQLKVSVGRFNWVIVFELKCVHKRSGRQSGTGARGADGSHRLVLVTGDDQSAAPDQHTNQHDTASDVFIIHTTTSSNHKTATYWIGVSKPAYSGEVQLVTAQYHSSVTTRLLSTLTRYHTSHNTPRATPARNTKQEQKCQASRTRMQNVLSNKSQSYRRQCHDT